MKDITVLLTGTGAPGAPGIIHCLRKNNERNIKIIGVDANENAGAKDLVDSFFTVPMAKYDNFIESIFSICRRESVDVVIPIVTRELQKFADNKHLFESAGIKVSVMSSDILNIVNNKSHLLTKMKEIGMAVPEFRVVNSVEEIEKACLALGFPEKPVCVKGSVGNGSRGVRLLDAQKSKYDLLFNEKPNSMYISYEELIRTLSEKPEIPEMMVMELLPGDEYGIDFLCDKGKVLYSAGRYNYTVNSSIPQGCILEYREEPFKIAHELCEKIGISGNINFDFKYDSKGRARLIEINPRLSATIVAYAALGINFPYLGIKRLLDEEMPVCNIRYGAKMVRRYEEIFFDVDGKIINW